MQVLNKFQFVTSNIGDPLNVNNLHFLLLTIINFINVLATFTLLFSGIISDTDSSIGHYIEVISGG